MSWQTLSALMTCAPAAATTNTTTPTITIMWDGGTPRPPRMGAIEAAPTTTTWGASVTAAT
jgi:hypothetical protein